MKCPQMAVCFLDLSQGTYVWPILDPNDFCLMGFVEKTGAQNVII